MPQSKRPNHAISLKQLCRRYLNLETEYVRRQLESVQAIRNALLDRELEALSTTLQTISAAPIAELSEMRRTVRTQLSRQLNIAPEDVLLDDVARFLDDHVNGDAMQQVMCLRSQREEIHRINQANVTTSLVLSRMVDRFLRLVGGPQSVTTYGPSGQLERSHVTEP